MIVADSRRPDTATVLTICVSIIMELFFYLETSRYTAFEFDLE